MKEKGLRRKSGKNNVSENYKWKRNGITSKWKEE